jgi:multidrug transporter EmrE-like cation transporter
MLALPSGLTLLKVHMNGWLFLGIAIWDEAIATSALKASYGFSKLVPSVLALVGYKG